MCPKTRQEINIPTILKNKENLYEGNLVEYIRVIFDRAENLENPYHNFRHICHVLWLCYQACLYYSGKLSKRQMRNLLIAALFHDFNHTGTASPDSENIERAIQGFREYILPEDKPHQKTIEQLIRHTQFPNPEPDEKISLLGQIIRDADLSQIFSVAWIQQVVFGLAKEWNKTPLEILKMQEKFLGNLEFGTSWAKWMFPREEINEKMLEARELVDILT